jgi:hypothetical protein
MNAQREQREQTEVMRSYRLASDGLGELILPGRFWEVLHTRATLVDSVRRECGEIIECILDFLASERNIHLPYGATTDDGAPLSVPSDSRVVTCLTRHEAQVLRSRLRKTGLDCKVGEVIGESYNHRDEGSKATIRQCLDFLARQVEHFEADDERILVIVTREDPSMTGTRGS